MRAALDRVRAMALYETFAFGGQQNLARLCDSVPRRTPGFRRLPQRNPQLEPVVLRLDPRSGLHPPVRPLPRNPIPPPQVPNHRPVSPPVSVVPAPHLVDLPNLCRTTLSGSRPSPNARWISSTASSVPVHPCRLPRPDRPPEAPSPEPGADSARPPRSPPPARTASEPRGRPASSSQTALPRTWRSTSSRRSSETTIVPVRTVSPLIAGSRLRKSWCPPTTKSVRPATVSPWPTKGSRSRKTRSPGSFGRATDTPISCSVGARRSGTACGDFWKANTASPCPSWNPPLADFEAAKRCDLAGNAETPKVDGFLPAAREVAAALRERTRRAISNSGMP